MRVHKIGARAEFRLQEEQRIMDSASLADEFRTLKSLTVQLGFFSPEGVNRSSQIKYKVNLANAKSAFSFSCRNDECVRGDFDLSEKLAAAIRARRKTVTGEVTCQGWRNKTTIDTVRCRNILRYEFSLTYSTPRELRMRIVPKKCAVKVVVTENKSLLVGQ